MAPSSFGSDPDECVEVADPNTGSSDSWLVARDAAAACTDRVGPGDLATIGSVAESPFLFDLAGGSGVQGFPIRPQGPVVGHFVGSKDGGPAQRVC